MNIDPMDLVEPDDAQKEADLARRANKKSQLNTAVVAPGVVGAIATGTSLLHECGFSR